jgi:hypothetical protein
VRSFQAQRLLDLLFLVTDDDLVPDDHCGKGTARIKFLHIFDDSLALIAFKQVDVDEFILDRALPQKLLGGLAVAAGAQGVYFHIRGVFRIRRGLGVGLRHVASFHLAPLPAHVGDGRCGLGKRQPLGLKG